MINFIKFQKFNIFLLCSFLSILLSSVVTGEDVKYIPNNLNTNAAVENLTKHKIWPRGRILYYIDEFSFDKILRDRIREYLADVRSQTGLQFEEILRPPANNQTRWVLFVNRRGQLGCDDYYATKFTDVGVQRVVLGYDCVGAAGSGLAAAVLALAGVPPQHNAPDRDQYITIEQKNIIPGKSYLFAKLAKEEWLFNEFEYDFNSASHYDIYKYTKNGLVTIKPKKQKFKSFEEPPGLSVIDKLKIKKLYKTVKSLDYNINLCMELFIRKKRPKLLSAKSIYDPAFRDLQYFSDFIYSESESDDIDRGRYIFI